MKRYTAAEVIAIEFCSDISDIKDGRYQPGQSDKPIYVVGNDYYCATRQGQKPAKLRGSDRFEWMKYKSSFADSIGWQIWECKC